MVSNITAAMTHFKVRPASDSSRNRRKWKGQAEGFMFVALFHMPTPHKVRERVLHVLETGMYFRVLWRNSFVQSPRPDLRPNRFDSLECQGRLAIELKLACALRELMQLRIIAQPPFRCMCLESIVDCKSRIPHMVRSTCRMATCRMARS